MDEEKLKGELLETLPTGWVQFIPPRVHEINPTLPCFRGGNGKDYAAKFGRLAQGIAC
jgi:hypothetical protein